jgi:DnaJ-class molecular chaperone
MTKIYTNYDILCVQRTASAEIIKGAYRKLCSKFHPDRNPEKDTTGAMQEINAAYAVLSDPVKKADYDVQLALDAMLERWQPKPAQEPPVSPTASSHSSAAEDIANDFDAPPKRKPKARPEKATEPTAEQQQAKREALRVEVLRMCSVPPAFILNEAGVIATRKWKATAAKWHRFASLAGVSIEDLAAARKAMLQAAAVRAN